METCVLLLKQRLDMMPGVNARDDYIESRLAAAEEELAHMGITLIDSREDTMLLVDYTAWSYTNRDRAGDMPDWLNRKIRQRRLSLGRSGST